MEKYFLGNEGKCACGIVHCCPSEVYVDKGAVSKLGEIISKVAPKCIYVIADTNTYNVAGAAVEGIIKSVNIKCASFVFENSPHPDEKATDAAMGGCPDGADMIIGIGSGVINDIGKLISSKLRVKYVIVATAPSMDGYASSSSSMTVGGLKVSLPSKMPDYIIGDIDIIATAPLKMLVSGVGDMLAKYIGLAEWKIGAIINGEYYCEKIHDFMKNAVERVVSAVNTYGIDSEEALSATFEGLISAGFAMSYANSTRPASGADHYISHIYDMRGVAFGTATEMHGIQAALGTFICLELYEKLKALVPGREKAVSAVGSFDLSAWHEELKALVGEKAATAMIELEKKEGKYSTVSHAKRLEVIISRWSDITAVINELPNVAIMKDFYRKIDLPISAEEAGLDGDILNKVVSATRDIRDKYVISRLAFDMGITELYEVK